MLLHLAIACAVEAKRSELATQAEALREVDIAMSARDAAYAKKIRELSAQTVELQHQQEQQVRVSAVKPGTVTIRSVSI